MRYAILFLLLLPLTVIFGQGLDNNPVTWTFELGTPDKENNTIELIATATIDNNWALYSQHTPDGGPIATSFDFGDAEIIGKTAETKPKKEYSDLFELDVLKFKEKAVFTQKLKFSDFSKKLKGSVRFMCCDGQKCLAPTEVSFEFDI